jgi:hypothetical protein
MSSAEPLPHIPPTLPIFPLPSVQLFPHALLPLHVFEPRYRALVRDAVAGAQLIAMPSLLPGYEADYDGRPAVRPVCGVGRVVAFDPLPDGRSNILLEGVARLRITDELPPEHLYRVVRADRLADVYPADDPLDDEKRTLVLLADQLSMRLPEGGETLRTLARSQPEAGAICDVLAAALLTDGGERQELLEELDVQRRLQRMTEHLGTMLARFADHHGPAN